MITVALSTMLMVASTGVLLAQGRSILPPPPGAAAIGRVTYYWVDSARRETFSPDAETRREVVVDVWYPARRVTGPPAPYLPNVEIARRVMGDSAVRRRYAPAFAAMETGRLETHAVEGAPAQCAATGCPVLIFSHGGGVDRSLYTVQYEDLAAHGYAVVALAHPYFTHTVVFADGRSIRLAPRPRDTTRADPPVPAWRRQMLATQTWVRRRSDIAAGDTRFVIDQLSRYARDPSLGAPFTGHLDLDRIGALGHSAGGMIAARACQTDARIKACLNQDGVSSGLPFNRDPDGATMRQPFLYFGRVEPPVPPLSDSQRVALQMTRAEDDSLVRVLPLQHTALLRDMPGGAWRVRLDSPGAVHMSFSDEPLILADGDSTKTANALLALRIVQHYTRAFFDKTLLGRTATALDRPTSDTLPVTVERFPPPAARRQPDLSPPL